jgi:hypothetical protein
MGHGGVLLTLDDDRYHRRAIPTQGTVSFLPLDRSRGLRGHRVAGPSFVEKNLKIISGTVVQWSQQSKRSFVACEKGHVWGITGRRL